MMDSSTLQQFESVLTLYQETQETLKPIVDLAEQTLGDEWTNQLHDTLASAWQNKENKEDLLNKADHAIHYYGALAAWEEVSSYLSGSVPYTKELLDERMPVLEYWLGLFGNDGQALLSQLKEASEKLNTEPEPAVEKEVEKAEQESPEVNLMDVSSDITDKKKHSEENAVAVDAKKEETPATEVVESKPTAEEAKSEEPADVAENVPANSTISDVDEKENEKTVEPVKEENVSDDNKTQAPEEQTNEEVKEQGTEEISQPAEPEQEGKDVIVEEDVKTETAPEPISESVPETEILQEPALDTQSAVESASEQAESIDEIPSVNDIPAGDEDKIEPLDMDAKNQQVQDVFGQNFEQNDKTDEMHESTSLDEAMKELESLPSVDEQLNAKNKKEDQRQDEKATPVDKTLMPEIVSAVAVSDENKEDSLDKLKTAEESRNWDIATFVHLNNVYNEVCNWLSGWCIHNNADKLTYPHYGFIVDLMYDLREKAMNILDNQLVEEQIEHDVPGGRDTVEKIRDALDAEIEGLPDDLKRSTIEKMQLSAREILGQIDTSDEKEDIGAPPDGFELMDDPYAVSKEEIISDFEKNDEKTQNQIDNSPDMDKNV